MRQDQRLLRGCLSVSLTFRVLAGSPASPGGSAAPQGAHGDGRVASAAALPLVYRKRCTTPSWSQQAAAALVCPRQINEEEMGEFRDAVGHGSCCEPVDFSAAVPDVHG